jgi:hypothetical protein
MIDITKFQELPREKEIEILIVLLQEVGGNIHQTDRLYKQYWIESMKVVLQEYIELSEKIKNRLIILFNT